MPQRADFDASRSRPAAICPIRRFVPPDYGTPVVRTAVSTSGPPALLDDAIEAILATARSPRERNRQAWWTSPWCWRFGPAGLRRSEAAALVWSDIGRWNDGSGRLLIGRSKTDQTGEGEGVFITGRAMTTPEELRQLLSMTG